MFINTNAKTKIKNHRTEQQALHTAWKKIPVALPTYLFWCIYFLEYYFFHKFSFIQRSSALCSFGLCPFDLHSFALHPLILHSFALVPFCPVLFWRHSYIGALLSCAHVDEASFADHSVLLLVQFLILPVSLFCYSSKHILLEIDLSWALMNKGSYYLRFFTQIACK